MKKHNRKKEKRQGKSQRFSVRAPLIAIGHLVRQWKLLDTIQQKVKIAQKTVKHTPFEKLTDAFISLGGGCPRVM